MFIKYYYINDFKLVVPNICMKLSLVINNSITNCSLDLSCVLLPLDISY